MDKTLPLASLRVLELARVLAGPWIGQTLADLGATVIKIEGPKGDETRHWGPPYAPNGQATYFQSCNRGKHSVIADFNNAEDLAMIRGLATEADVLVENFKVGGLTKFGLDYPTLSASNPRLIYCSVTGFGQTGPMAHLPGYDFIIQGMAGVMDLTGTPDGPPIKTGIALADLFTAMYGLVGIQAALIQRQTTGRGQHIDMALYDSLAAMLGNQASAYLMTGKSPARLGNTHPSIVPYEVYDASDAPLIIACGNDGQFQRLCAALGTTWHEDPRFATNPKRLENRTQLSAMMAEAVAARTRSDVLQAMEAAGVPAGPINSVADALDNDHVTARGLVRSYGDTRAVALPISATGMAKAELDAPPALDQHGDAVRQQGWKAVDPDQDR
ncbi:CaiB/BaiF CoA transferase family protein [Halovulum sp. GXIMD14793]